MVVEVKEPTEVEEPTEFEEPEEIEPPLTFPNSGSGGLADALNGDFGNGGSVSGPEACSHFPLPSYPCEYDGGGATETRRDSVQNSARYPRRSAGMTVGGARAWRRWGSDAR